MITIIAAIGLNNEIGYDNKLIWSIPEDMKHFKEYTMGKVIIMGRKTFQSIGKVLPGRRCVVISTSDLHGTAIPAHDVTSALSIEHCYPELVIIGGSSVYNQTIALADKLVITHIKAEFKADTFFPHIDPTEWEMISEKPSKNEHYEYCFTEYRRIR